MADEKAGKAPEGNGGKGLENEGEVGGRGYSTRYKCWGCGAINIVDSDWSYFVCWNCQRLNTM